MDAEKNEGMNEVPMDDAHVTAPVDEAIPVFDAVIEDAPSNEGAPASSEDGGAVDTWAVAADAESGEAYVKSSVEVEGNTPEEIREAAEAEKEMLQARLENTAREREEAVAAFGNTLYNATRDDLYLTSRYPELYDAITACDKRKAELEDRLARVDEKAQLKIEAIEKAREAEAADAAAADDLARTEQAAKEAAERAAALAAEAEAARAAHEAASLQAEEALNAAAKTELASFVPEPFVVDEATEQPVVDKASEQPAHSASAEAAEVEDESGADNPADSAEEAPSTPVPESAPASNDLWNKAETAAVTVASEVAGEVENMASDIVGGFEKLTGNSVPGYAAPAGYTRTAPAPAAAPAPAPAAEPVQAPASAAAAPSTRVCAQCGTQVAADDVFCFSCGSKLETQAAPAPAPTAPVAACCPNCGAEYAAGDMFCMMCGHKLG